MTDIFDAGKFGAIVALPFQVANAVTSATNTDLTVPGGANTLYVMPHAGSVVGISVKASADVTAGSANFRAHKASTEFADSGYPNPTLDATNSNASYAKVNHGALRFAAGNSIGVSYSSTTDAAPTNTNDYDVLLFVSLDPI